jgi:hypothetical protein
MVVAIRTIAVALGTIATVEKATSKLPFADRARDAVLDTIFGQAEPFDYVSTTAPPTPCPE